MDRCDEWVFEADGHGIIEAKSLESVIRTLYAVSVAMVSDWKSKSSVVHLAGLKGIFAHFHYAHVHSPVKPGVFTDRSISSPEGID